MGVNDFSYSLSGAAKDRAANFENNWQKPEPKPNKMSVAKKRWWAEKREREAEGKK